MDDDANLPRDAPIAYADPLAHGEPDEAPHGEAEEGEAEPENAPAVAVDPVTAAEERARADQARLELRVEEIRAGVRTPNEEILLRCLNAVEVENARLERLVDQTLAPDENRGGSPGPGWLAEDAAVDRPWDDTSEAQKKRDEWKSNDSDMRGRTRQADSTFYDKPESQCLVSFKTQHTLLKSALELNQKLFWKVLECHAPQQQREEYLEGWRLVRFGKDDLSEAFPQGIERALGHVFPALSVDACGGMTGLRNAVHHPKSFPSDKVEELLRKAQGFAIELTNEKYAMRIRRWRDQFQEEVEKAHAELAQWVVGMTSLPTSHLPLLLHHQKFLHEF